MQYLKNLFRFFEPNSVSCNDRLDTELPHDQIATDEDYSPVHPTIKRRVPGFDHLLNPIMAITGDHQFIKGFKFDVSFPLSEYFQILQTWEIPNSGIKEQGQNMMQMMMGRGPAKPNYTFMTQVVRDVTSPVEPPGLVMVGKADSEGKVDSILVKKLSEKLNLKLTGSFMSSKTEDGALGADLQYEDSDTTSVFKLNHHPMQGAVAQINYMQRIHKNVLLGFDFTHLFAHKKQLFGYGGKLFIGNHSLYANSIQSGAIYNIGYIIPIQKRTTFVAHYKVQAENNSSTILGLKQRYDSIDITATISSKAKFTTILGLKSPFFGLKLCAEADYGRDHYSFGYGVSIGQQQ